MTPDPLHDARNYAQVFLHWGAVTPDTTAFRHLRGDNTSSTVTYGALDRSARRIAAALLERVERGDRALLLYQPGLDFVEAFVACLYAGVVPVPMFPPNARRIEQTLPTTRAIADSAGAAIVLCDSQVQDMLRSTVSDTSEFCGIPWLATDAVDGDAEASLSFDAGPDDLAFLQFTSGSTSAPRGVMVQHGNLLHNERGIRRAFGHDRFYCRAVGWLPTYHDMGLIGKVLQTAYVGGSTVLMAPSDFLQRPYRWLRTITEHRGTTAGGPNFAYELCTRRLTDEQIETLDLSSWEVAFCGAEPVHHATLERFVERFAPAGFRREALYPCYGLAEGTLMVTGGWLGRGAETHWLRTEALERHRAEMAAPRSLGSSAQVSCGTVIDGQKIAIVDPLTCQRLDPDTIGEIWVQGPSVAAGYWRAPEASEETFRAQLVGEPGYWLRTGDLGVARAGQLIVTGRRKDLLILHGRNVYPHDVEKTVGSAHAGIYDNSVAAVGLPVEGGERLGLMVGLRRGDADEVERAIRQAVAVVHGLSVHRLVLVRPWDIPRTSSGKIQRAVCQRRMLSMVGENGGNGVDSGDSADAATDHPVSMYRPPTDELNKLEARNTRYRFDLDADVSWDRVHEPGLYFPQSALAQAGVDMQVLDRVPGLLATFQWALAVAICEEFVALEQRILGFLRDERAAGRLPATRSADLFEEEEVKHVALFRRYADHLKAERPAIAATLDGHLERSFQTAWWHRDSIDTYPSAEVFHFVNWLHFVYFEEYSIYVCNQLKRDGDVQPAWLTAHIAHMQEERQHVLTDAAHLNSLILGDDERREWSRWFLEQSAEDASGLAGLGGVWTFVQEQFPEAADLPQPQALMGNDDLKRRAFLRLITTKQEFARTVSFATGLADFENALLRPMAAEYVGTAPGTDVEQRIREFLVRAVAESLDIPPERVSTTSPLIHFGLDSVAAVNISGELENVLGRKLPPTILFDYPTIEAIAAALADLDSPPVSTPVHRHGDAMLDPTIFEMGGADEPQNVLITGATGFLCGFLLADLLRATPHRAHCLVRATSRAAGLERVRGNLTRYGLWDDRFTDRIAIVVGDLEQPQLGLSQDEISALADQLDAIYHGGAIVDFIQPYERLRAANVQGTHEIIRLAFQGGRLPLNFISTIAIFDTRDQNGSRQLTEADVPNADAGFRNGYGESKWIAEQLVTQAGQRGLPIRVFRPGVVSGDTEHGAWQPDLAATLLKTYAVQGNAISPAPNGVFNAAPVDYVARAILHIARAPRSMGGVYHLTNPRPTTWDEIYAAMARIGHPVRVLPYGQWMDAIAVDDRSHELRPFLPYFRARGQVWQIRQPRMDCSRTLAALDGSGIVCPPFDERLLSTYLDYLLAGADRDPPRV